MIADILRNFNLYVDGRGYAGRVDEVSLPKLVVMTEEHRAGGMDLPVEIDLGMEKLELAFTLSAFDADVLRQFGLAPGASVPATIRGALQDEDGTVKPVVVNARGILREVDPGTWKPGEKATLQGVLALRYYKLTIDGDEIHEIDAENMVRKIGGTDQLVEVRKALGVA